MDALIAFHTVNVILGSFCTIIAATNVFLFLSTAKFRVMYKILTVLAVADLINTISKIMMGINRRNLYSDILNTHLIPIRNSWDCAIEPWLWMQGIGK
uniref:Uncharacterized protein n=1 Tax=Panagrolaimus davidi TaxID=227884 RepID=A0A914P8Y4_9BILA